MLHHRQIVVVVRHVVQDALHQTRPDVEAAPPHRADDCLLALVARQLGHQHQAAADGLGKPREIGAVAERIGTQRDDDAQRSRKVKRRVQQQLDERPRFFRIADALEAEDLLELVHHDDHTLAWRQLGRAHRVGQADCAQTQPAVQRADGLG